VETPPYGVLAMIGLTEGDHLTIKTFIDNLRRAGGLTA
jgi:hypothetical protein